MKLFVVKEISEMRKRMATLREDNRKLRNDLVQRNFKNNVTKKKDDSLYYLLQEFMVENNALRHTNKELMAKAIQESKFRMKTQQDDLVLPKLVNDSLIISDSEDKSKASSSPFKDRLNYIKLQTNTIYV